MNLFGFALNIDIFINLREELLIFLCIILAFYSIKLT